MSSYGKPTKQCLQRLQREYKQINKVVRDREERRRILHAQQLQEEADREQNPLYFSAQQQQQQQQQPQQQQQQPQPPQSSSSSSANHASSSSNSVPTPSVSDELLFTAAPDPDNLLRWYFLFESPPEEPVYAGGKYIGEFVFPTDYPFKPPKIFLLTPNGRFATGKEICLSNSSYHPESWSPAWSIETVLLGMISFFYSDEHTTGAIDHVGPRAQTVAEKKKRARESKGYNVKELKQVYRRVFPEEYERDVTALEAAEGEGAGEKRRRDSGDDEGDVSRRLPPPPPPNSNGDTGHHTHHHDVGANHNNNSNNNNNNNNNNNQPQQENNKSDNHHHHHHHKDNDTNDNNNSNTKGSATEGKEGAAVKHRNRSSPHWSTLLFLIIALMLTVRIVIL